MSGTDHERARRPLPRAETRSESTMTGRRPSLSERKPRTGASTCATGAIHARTLEGDGAGDGAGTDAHARAGAQARTHAHTCMHARIRTRTRVRTHMHTNVHAHAHAHIHAYILRSARTDVCGEAARFAHASSEERAAQQSALEQGIKRNTSAP
eukprot:6207021-Pleurochrysis_carterae.AAC.2